MRHFPCDIDIALKSGRQVHVSEIVIAPPEPDVGILGYGIDDFTAASDGPSLTGEECDEIADLLMDMDIIEDFLFP